MAGGSVSTRRSRVSVEGTYLEGVPVVELFAVNALVLHSAVCIFYETWIGKGDRRTMGLRKNMYVKLIDPQPKKPPTVERLTNQLNQT